MLVVVILIVAILGLGGYVAYRRRLRSNSSNVIGIRGGSRGNGRTGPSK